MKKASGRTSGRPQKLGDLIQRELSDLIAREVRDPRVGMLTITSVDVSPELSHAKVFFTLLDKQKLPETLDGLKRSAGLPKTKRSAKSCARRRHPGIVRLHTPGPARRVE